MRIELQKDEYIDIMKCLVKGLFTSEEDEQKICMYRNSSGEMVFAHYKPHFDIGKKYKNEEDTFYQTAELLPEETTPAKPYIPIKISSWKELQQVIDLMKKDTNENENKTD